MGLVSDNYVYKVDDSSTHISIVTPLKLILRVVDLSETWNTVKNQTKRANCMSDLLEIYGRF